MDPLNRLVGRVGREWPPAALVTQHINRGAPLRTTTFVITDTQPEAPPGTGLLNDLATCPDCLREMADPSNRRYGYAFTTCSACGKDTTVPFRPTQGRPVFCKECFQQRKFAGAGGV